MDRTSVVCMFDVYSFCIYPQGVTQDHQSFISEYLTQKNKFFFGDVSHFVCLLTPSQTTLGHFIPFHRVYSPFFALYCLCFFVSFRFFMGFQWNEIFVEEGEDVTKLPCPTTGNPFPAVSELNQSASQPFLRSLCSLCLCRSVPSLFELFNLFEDSLVQRSSTQLACCVSNRCSGFGSTVCRSTSSPSSRLLHCAVQQTASNLNLEPPIP